MRVTSELPNRQWQPGVDQQFRRITTGRSQQQRQRDDGKRVERCDHHLHAEHARRCGGSQCKDRLRRWRIDGGRIFGAVDVRIHRCIAQERKLIGGWQIAVRVDTGKLHATIPHVSIHVGRQNRRRGQGQQPHRHSDAEHQPDGARWQPPLANDRHREQPQRAGDAQTGDERCNSGFISQTHGPPVQQPQPARHQTRERQTDRGQHRQATRGIAHCAAKLMRPFNPLRSIHALVAGAA